MKRRFQNWEGRFQNTLGFWQLWKRVSKYELKNEGGSKNKKAVSKLTGSVQNMEGWFQNTPQFFETLKTGSKIQWILPPSHVVTPAPSKFGPGPLKNRPVPAGGGGPPEEEDEEEAEEEANSYSLSSYGEFLLTVFLGRIPSVFSLRPHSILVGF